MATPERSSHLHNTPRQRSRQRLEKKLARQKARIKTTLDQIEQLSTAHYAGKEEKLPTFWQTMSLFVGLFRPNSKPTRKGNQAKKHTPTTTTKNDQPQPKKEDLFLFPSNYPKRRVFADLRDEMAYWREAAEAVPGFMDSLTPEEQEELWTRLEAENEAKNRKAKEES